MSVNHDIDAVLRELEELEGGGFTRRAFLGRLGGLAAAASLAGVSAAAAAAAPQRAGPATRSAVPPIDPSKVGGRLNWLGFQGYDDRGAIGTWLKQRHVDLRTTYGSSNDDWIPKLRAGGIGTYDNLTIYFAYVPTLAQLGLVQPIPLSALPNFKNLYPQFQSAARAVPGPADGVYFVPLVWGRAELVYSSKFVPQGLQSYYDVLKPQYKGRLVLLDDTLTNVATWASVLGYNTASMTKEQLSRVTDLMIRAKKNARTIAPDFGEQTDLFARGEVWMTIGGWSALIKWAADKGEKGLKLAKPKEKTWSWTDTYTLVKDAPHRDTAVALINEIISPSAQVGFAKAVVSGVTNRLATPRVPPDLRALYPYSDINAAFRDAPLLILPPLLADKGKNGTVVFRDWVNAWNKAKAA